MRDKVIALAAVASAGVAIAVGLTIGALGGAFDDTSQKVRPPAIQSDNLNSVQASPSSTIVIVPPSPTWQVAEPTTPRPTTTTQNPTETTTPDKSRTTTRPSRRTTGSDETTTSSEDDESGIESTTSESRR